MIRISRDLLFDETEIEERFIHSAGPGGQNVNKVATAVELRFDVNRSASLSEPIRHRLALLAGRRLNREGVLVITARTHRSQDQNRREALDRLVDLIAAAAVVPRVRRPTRVPPSQRRLRLTDKRVRSRLKVLRGSTSD